MNQINEFITKQISSVVPDFDSLEVSMLVGKASYSLEFFVTKDNIRKQCYDMVDEGVIDENKVDDVANIIADYIRKQPDYDASKPNKIEYTVCK